ncbi:MAG: hypothetical protein ACRDFC_04550 [Ignavibacteria bacterium]
MFKKIITVIFCLITSFIYSCKPDPVNPPQTQSGNLNLNISRLEDLGTSALYEGWIMVSGNPVSTGTFSVNTNGQLSRTSFPVNASNLSSATAFVLTIEPVPDPDPPPSTVKLMGGDFSGNTALLSIAHPSSIGNDLSSATGKYILATPTNGPNSDELSGVWFMDLNIMPPQGLHLPTLPAGWVYEGWAVINGIPVTTGRFVNPAAPDSAAPYSGNQPAPPFPGEDFLMNAPMGLTFPTNLQGKFIVITVEPSPDNSLAPFSLKPLIANVPSNAMPMVTYNMTNQSSTNNPSGTATR